MIRQNTEFYSKSAPSLVLDQPNEGAAPLSPAQHATKRVLDVLLIMLSLPFLALCFGLIALAIKLDSAGPVFYTQRRIGHGGRVIRIWKFRSMAWNADALLKEYLEQDRTLQTEWQESFKLRDDPRITRFGRLLRRTSP